MRLRLGSGFGIPVYLHWTFFLLPLLVLWSHPEESSLDLALVFTLLPLMFGCVVLHEFGHALMARRFGIATEDVTLYPIGGVARLTRMTDKPIEELLIAVAGPAVNVAIAIALAGVLAAGVIVDPNMVIGTFPGHLLLSLLILNVIMVPFNLLPAFPMDGGRVLRASLSAWLGHYRGTQIAVHVGVVMAILMGLGGVLLFHNPMLGIIAVFIFFAGQQELMVAHFRERQLRQQQYEEPLTVLPVWPARKAQLTPQVPELMFQPRILVYTWDNQTGTWRKEPGTLS
jgi:Zn-dependent protease